jgi:hypothetical protein
MGSPIDPTESIDPLSAEELGRGYVLPVDAGPAMREAYEYGLDLSLLAETLRMTEEERMEANQRAKDNLLLLNPNLLDEPRPDEIGYQSTFPP